MSAFGQKARTCRRCGEPLKAWSRGSVCWRCMVAVEPPPRGEDRSAAPRLPAGGLRLGDYLLEEEIAHGGMGVVYRARQISLDRTVAVKLLLLGRHSSPESVERFRREAQAAATLRHPNIVAVHEVGECHGQHFFSMELVEGRSLANQLREGLGSPRQAAAIVREIAGAIHYAHERGILHRDLKPSNVLLDPLGQVRVTDFGLAKRLDGSSDLTVTGQMMGTPNYLSPEQAAGRNEELGPASDVYSLGALFYELLTGRPPFLANSLQDTLLNIRDKDPVAPRALIPATPRDLETICLKCLEKDSARRYPTARALAADLARWERSEPIEARPVGALERAVKWLRRHPERASALAALAATVLVGFAGVIWQWQRAEEQRRQAVAERETTRRHLYVSDMFGASQALNRGNLGQVRAALARWQPRAGAADLRGFEWHCLEVRARGDQAAAWVAHSNMVVGLSFSPDGRWLASASRDRTVKLWDVASGQLQHTFAEFSNVLFAVSFSPDGRRLVAGGWGVVHVWDLPSRRLLASRRLDVEPQLRGNNPQIRPEFSPVDSDWVALGMGASDSGLPLGGEVLLWNVATGAERLLPAAGGRPAFSRDGRWLATGGTEQVCRVWDVATGRLRHTLDCGANVVAVAFVGRGPLLACSTWDGQVQLWDAEVGALHRVLRGAGLRHRALAVSPDGQRVMAGGVDPLVQVWSLETAAEPHAWRGHGNEIWSLAISADGRTVASGDKSGMILIWAEGGAGARDSLANLQLAPAGEQTLWPWAVGQPVLSPDSLRLAAARVEGGVGVWRVDGLRGGIVLPRERIPLAFAPDSRVLLTLGDEPVCRFWTVEDGTCVGEFPFRPGWDFEHAARMAPQGDLFAINQRSGRTVLWDPLTSLPAGVVADGAWSAGMAFSPDGRFLLTGTVEGTSQLYEISTRRLLARLPRHLGRVLGAAFAPDGQVVATGGADNLVRLWDVAARVEMARLEGHQDGVTCVAFSADGETLASGGNDRTVRLWHQRTGRALGVFEFHREITYVAFAPRGDLLLIGEGNRGPLHLWRGARAEGEAPAGSVRGAAEPGPLPGRWPELLRVARENLAAKRRLPLFPSRDGRLRPQLVDLSGHFNAGLEETWAVWDHANDLSALDPGVRRFGGVEFDLRGVVVLAGGPESHWPERVEGIPVGVAARKAHFLHAANLVNLDYEEEQVAAGTMVARYVVHYAGGAREEKPVVLGRELDNWHLPRTGATQATAGTLPRVVWSSANPISRRSGRATALFLSTWENPRPETVIERIDFVSAWTRAEPFLLGITVE